MVGVRTIRILGTSRAADTISTARAGQPADCDERPIHSGLVHSDQALGYAIDSEGRLTTERSAHANCAHTNTAAVCGAVSGVHTNGVPARETGEA